MFYIGAILPFTTVFLSASSIYYEREEPNLYEGMLYSDSSQDENVAAMDYSRKRKDVIPSPNFIYLPPGPVHTKGVKEFLLFKLICYPI